MLISVDLPVSLFRGAMPVGGALIALICLGPAGRADPGPSRPKT
jgi:hypothetical protein